MSVLGSMGWSQSTAMEREEIIVESRISSGTDDAEEDPSGKMSLTSADLDLAFDSSGSESDQIVGLRFNGIDIPQGAVITNAHIQFQADEVHAGAVTLLIEGEANDSAVDFSDADSDISSRPRTTEAVSWSPLPWETEGEAGSLQQTPDIAPVVQEIVDRTGWSPGNSIVVIISGSGERTAEAFEGDEAGAPLLRVAYQVLPEDTPTVEMETETSDLQALEEQIQRLEAELAGSRVDTLSLEADVVTLTAENERFGMRLAEEQEALSQFRVQFVQEIGALAAENEGLEARLAEEQEALSQFRVQFVQEIGALAEENERLQTELAGSRLDNLLLQAELDAVPAEVETQEPDSVEVGEKVMQLEAEKAELQESLARVSEQLEQLEADLASIKESFGVAEVDTATLMAMKAIYTVRPGDSLFGIALDFYGDGSLWPDILAANGVSVEDTGLILPGTVLLIPR
ncbi:MAG: LysM peptidoglycan-binding domain-containing protein [Trueperaceae bacterium]|nr:MAG: LysM peptidoglycan-binding domain-containing protein [Trueperaceae bacterium]